MRAKTLPYAVALACSAILLAGSQASADDKKDSKPALSGDWTLKGAELRIEFCDKNVVKICPHGDDKVIAILCEYTVDKQGLVKAKVTGIEGKDEAKKVVKDLLPVGTEFSFKWKVTDDSAKLDDVKGDMAEHLKSHLEGEYKKK
jgi:hypothetical protein